MDERTGADARRSRAVTLPFEPRGKVIPSPELLRERVAERSEAFGGFVERLEQTDAVLEGKRDDRAVLPKRQVQFLRERLAWIKQPDQRFDVLFPDVHAGEIHGQGCNQQPEI